MEKLETIAKQLEDERDEPMAALSDRQLLEEERRKKKDEKREAVLRTDYVLPGCCFAVG
jgi:hypothetical protein